jgi:CBS domain-containing protein
MDWTTRPDATRDALTRPGLTVADVMRSDFRSCDPSTPIAEAAVALRLSGVPLLPVTTAQVPQGVVTEHGLALALAERRGDLSDQTAADVMARDVATARIGSDAATALDRLADVGHLLAVDGDGLLRGVLTLAEFGPYLSEHGLARLAVRLGARIAPAPAEVESSKTQAQPHPWDAPARLHAAPIPLVSPSDLVNPMLRARDVMTPDPRTCSPQSTVLEAAATFRDADCGVLPVVEAGRPVGVLTDRDAILALPEREFDLARTPVGDIMSRDLATVDAEADLKAVLDRLGDAGVRRLLVVDGHGRLAGVLSWTDLVPHLSGRGVGYAVSRIVGERPARTG